MLLVLGFSQRPSGEVTKWGVPGQKEGAGTEGDPGVAESVLWRGRELGGGRVRGLRLLQVTPSTLPLCQGALGLCFPI